MDEGERQMSDDAEKKRFGVSVQSNVVNMKIACGDDREAQVLYERVCELLLELVEAGDILANPSSLTRRDADDTR